MTDLLVGVILLMILGGAAFYIVKAKKSGRKCIGCPSAASCGKNGCCGCKH
ncbi:MAG: FeoB-associated Cys-rich membrane protein [Oscillospiraceae bacterium]|nr:FeoB-associated Cys-rich membrane protein [Oscillospiraceae bacterium]